MSKQERLAIHTALSQGQEYRAETTQADWVLVLQRNWTEAALFLISAEGQPVKETDKIPLLLNCLNVIYSTLILLS